MKGMTITVRFVVETNFFSMRCLASSSSMSLMSVQKGGESLLLFVFSGIGMAMVGFAFMLRASLIMSQSRVTSSLVSILPPYTL